MNNKDENWNENLESLLNKIIETSEREAEIIYWHIQSMREIKDAINNGTKLENTTRITWRESYFDACEIFTGKEFLNETYGNISEDTKIFRETLRDAMFEGMEKMQKVGPPLISEEEVKDSLLAFADFIETGRCGEEKTLPVIRYLAHVAMALSLKLKPFKV